jgi:LCP family protein required for cell wall assembly
MDDSGRPAEGGAAADDEGAAEPSGSAAAAGSSSAGQPKKRGFIGSHKALTALVVIVLLLAAGGGGYLWYLNSLIGNIKRVGVASLHPEPAKAGHQEEYPLNILLLGADHGAVGQSVADDLADGKWTPWKHLSDTIMLVHIPADRQSVQLVSIPRDTWTKIDGYPYDNGHAKINAAFSYGGPSLAVKTVEQLTHITIDHVAIIDWVGFKDLTTALGGIRVYIPHTFYDDSQRITWKAGWQTLEGERALQYVRTRHGLANGDFDRIKRQQNFLRETMAQVLSHGTTRNPIQLAKVVKVITSNLTVDDTWDNGEIRSLAWSLRNVSAGDVQFLTAPLGRYDTTPDGQSIVRLAPKQSKALFAAVKHDHVKRYLKKYPDAKLPNQKKVN